jgi:hypothetical protein
MNTEQLRFIHTNLSKTSCVLYGVPGSGKTTTCVKAMIHNNTSCLFLSFTNAGVEAVKSKLPYTDKIKVMTIHKAAMTIIYTNMNSVIYEANLVLNSSLTQKRCESIRSRFNHLHYIIVDEAQDISSIQYRFCKSLSSFFSIPLILAGDPNQAIYGFQSGSSQYLLNHSSSIYRLTTNYRSTHSLIQFFNHFHIHPTHMKPSNSTTSSLPQVYSLSCREAIDHILTDIYKHPIENRHNIAIVSSMGDIYSNTLIDSMPYMTLSLITCKYMDSINALQSELTNKPKIIFNTSNTIQPYQVNARTCHSVKGLEFDHVYVLQFNDITTTSSHMSMNTLSDNEYMFYVAMTRAKKSLTLISHNKYNIYSRLLPLISSRAISSSLFDHSLFISNFSTLQSTHHQLRTESVSISQLNSNIKIDKRYIRTLSFKSIIANSTDKDIVTISTHILHNLHNEQSYKKSMSRIYHIPQLSSSLVVSKSSLKHMERKCTTSNRELINKMKKIAITDHRYTFTNSLYTNSSHLKSTTLEEWLSTLKSIIGCDRYISVAHISQIIHNLKILLSSLKGSTIDFNRYISYPYCDIRATIDMTIDNKTILLLSYNDLNYNLNRAYLTSALVDNKYNVYVLDICSGAMYSISPLSSLSHLMKCISSLNRSQYNLQFIDIPLIIYRSQLYDLNTRTLIVSSCYSLINSHIIFTDGSSISYFKSVINVGRDKPFSRALSMLTC